MDAGFTNSSATKSQSRFRRKSVREDLDRFIPNRSAMDFDYAHCMLTTRFKKGKENLTGISLSREAYRKLLAETFNMNRTRILAFKNKLPTPPGTILNECSLVQHLKPVKPRRYIPQTADRTLDAPDLLDDHCLNLLDWGCSNVLAIALGSTVYLWGAEDGTIGELVTVDDEIGPVTSVKWAPDGRCISVGLNNSDVQLWDSTSPSLLRTLRGRHRSRVGSLDWNSHILTTGGREGLIVNYDDRIRSHIVETYTGHQDEVCGLKWSGSGQLLASGGNDSLLYIWDRSMASVNSPIQWLHRLEDHTATVRALAWCPFQGNTLASGAGDGDGNGSGGDKCIKFWNTHTGACLNSVDTGSEVCAILWNKNERELLSSHGSSQNQLTLWKYPSMVKMAELTGHRSRALFMAQHGYYLADGIYPEYAAIVKTISYPQDEKRKKFAKCQESARKDVERLFGALKKKFKIIEQPARAFTPKKLRHIMYACLILFNMINEDEGKAFCKYDPNDIHENVVPVDEAQQESNRWALHNPATHHALKHDLIEHVWQFARINPEHVNQQMV